MQKTRAPKPVQRAAIGLRYAALASFVSKRAALVEGSDAHVIDLAA
jgi:hypothetical protein